MTGSPLANVSQSDEGSQSQRFVGAAPRGWVVGHPSDFRLERKSCAHWIGATYCPAPISKARRASDSWNRMPASASAPNSAPSFGGSIVATSPLFADGDSEVG